MLGIKSHITGDATEAEHGGRHRWQPRCQHSERHGPLAWHL